MGQAQATVAGTAAAATGTASIRCSRSFDRWPEWTQVNARPIEGHEAWVVIYLDHTAAPAYVQMEAPMPVCARIVKVQYPSESSSTIVALTVMIKMGPGYDPEHGDWWYGLYDPSGKRAKESGRVEICIGCHALAADRDYLFAAEVLEASGR